VASNLDFLNKNLYRRYPFQQGTSLLSNNGLELPNDLIASVSLTTQLATSNLFVSQATLRNGYVSVTVQHYDAESDDSVVIGTFSAQITQDFQAVRLTAFVPGADGYMVFGGVTNISNYVGFYSLAYTDAVLEPSVVFCYVRPPVTSLILSNIILTGNVNFGNLINVVETSTAAPTNVFNFTVQDNSSILSLADFSSEFRNCPTPEILQINNATPYPHDATIANDSNIYLFGVDPITFIQDSTDGAINIMTPNLDLPMLCSDQTQKLPPVNPNFLINRAADSFVGDLAYFTKSQTPVVDFLEATASEYKVWPSYILTYVATLTNPSNGSHTIFDPSVDTPLLLSGQAAAISRIRFQTSTGSIQANFLVDSTSIAPNTRTITSEGIVLVPTADSAFVPSSKFYVDTASTSGSPTLMITMFYNITES
jgi:hypothetical protein